MRLVSIITLMLFSLIACAKETNPPSLNGEWVVRSVIDVAPVAAIDDAQLKSIEGKKLNITSQEISFEDKICETPIIKWSRHKPIKFFDSYRIDIPKNWNTKVYIADIECARPYSFGPILLDKTRILFVWKGALLEATRNKN